MKKALKIFLSVIVVLIIALFIIVNGWRQTPYGKLDSKVAVLLKLVNSMEAKGSKNEPDDKMNYHALREKFEIEAIKLADKPADLPVIRDIKIPGPAGDIPARVYAPKEKGTMPLIVYYHGGGWVVGSINSHDSICRRLAHKTGSVIISVSYRLAPENKFPAAADDAYAALVYVNKNADKLNGDVSKIAVAGDSAGGNLAAVVSLMARNKNGPKIAYQILMYPVTNLNSTDTQSYNNFSAGYVLTKWQMKQFIAYYIKDDADKKNPYASPLLATDLKDLPPAIVLTAQFDPLRDEGESYANKLIAANVPVVKKRFDGMIHGFMSLGKIAGQYNESIDLIADTLNKVYRK